MGSTSRHAEGVVPYEAPKIVRIFIVYICGSRGAPRRGIAHISGVLSFPSVEGWHARTHISTGQRRIVRVAGWFLLLVVVLS